MTKWTLVTGGAKRLGAALAEGIAKQGHSVLIHYKHSKKEVAEVVEACREMGVDAEAIAGDFSSEESLNDFIRRCLSSYPNIVNLVNNVGNYIAKSIEETSQEEWNDLFQTNLNAPFALSKAFLPSIRENHGNIINIGVVGLGRLDIYRPAYKIAKGALLTLTKSLARELTGSHVRVNMVSPGYLENAVDLPVDTAQLPMGRPALLEEVVRVVLFLLHADSGYITGQNIEVGGGIGL